MYVLPGNHLHLGQVNHVKVKYSAQGHKRIDILYLDINPVNVLCHISGLLTGAQLVYLYCTTSSYYDPYLIEMTLTDLRWGRHVHVHVQHLTS